MSVANFSCHCKQVIKSKTYCGIVSCKALFESCETVTRIHPLRHEYCVQDRSVSEKCVNHLLMSNPPGATSDVMDTQGYRGYRT